MSCYNYQYTGMPDCSGRDGFMDMSGWQSWQRSMDCSRNSGGMRDATAATPGWGWRPEQNPALPPVNPPEKTCLDSGRFPLAMSYVPMQTWSEPLPLDKAMTRGTIFRELDLPFIMGRCQ